MESAHVNKNRSSLMNELFGSDSDNSNDAENELDGVEIEENLESNSFNVEEAQDHFNSENESAEGPQTGMVYESIDSLFNAYQAHANRKGFSIIKRTCRKGNEIDYKYALMICDRGRKTAAQKLTKRIGCPARINAIKQGDGSWVVSKTIANHNHELDPTMSILMPAHRSLSINMKRQLEANDISGIRPSKNIRLCEVQAGGPQNLGCLPRDCRNFIDNRRRLRLGDGDAEAIRKLFARLQRKDANFYHLMDIDDEGRLRNILWIHPRSRAAYEDFHDVVSFDTTYLVNRYKMPFAVMVGVNHHGHSILLDVHW